MNSKMHDKNYSNELAYPPSPSNSKMMKWVNPMIQPNKLVLMMQDL